jgi:hypothetical protein
VNLLRRIALSSSLLAVLGLGVLAPAGLAGMHPQLAARLAGMANTELSI